MMMKMQENLAAMEERMLERMESMEATFSRIDSCLENLEAQSTNPGNLVSPRDKFSVSLNNSTKMSGFTLSFPEFGLCRLLCLHTCKLFIAAIYQEFRTCSKT